MGITMENSSSPQIRIMESNQCYTNVLILLGQWQKQNILTSRTVQKLLARLISGISPFLIGGSRFIELFGEEYAPRTFIIRKHLIGITDKNQLLLLMKVSKYFFIHELPS